VSQWRDAYVRSTRDPYVLSPDFVQALYRLDDGRLRIRWSQREQQWAIERRVARPLTFSVRRPPMAWQWNEDHTYKLYFENDAWIIARDGVTLIDLIPPQPRPGQWLITNLEYWRISRWLGNYRDVSDKLDDEKETLAKRKEKERRDRWRHIAGNTWEDYAWEGHRVAVPPNYKGA
jgi:hypothetical protein